jgi:creatinine amidohydrolase/Fe(II)-dependent formamide hydrolase-like protein
MVNRWSRVTKSGVEGDPMLATPEKGKAFSECSINNLVAFARLFRAYEVPPDADFNYQNDKL